MTEENNTPRVDDDTLYLTDEDIKMFQRVFGDLAQKVREPQVFETQAQALEIRVLIAEDGRDTIVTIEGKDEEGRWRRTSEGRARRRKKDPRDFRVGRALAMGRALQHLADREFAEAERRLG